MNRGKGVARCPSLFTNDRQRRIRFGMMEPNRVAAIQILALRLAHILINLKLQRRCLFETSVYFALINRELTIRFRMSSLLLSVFRLRRVRLRAAIHLRSIIRSHKRRRVLEILIHKLFLLQSLPFHFTQFHRAMQVNRLIIEWK